MCTILEAWSSQSHSASKIHDVYTCIVKLTSIIDGAKVVVIITLHLVLVGFSMSLNEVVVVKSSACIF